MPPAGEMSSRDQSGSVLVRTYPGTVCGGLVPVGGGSRGRREAVGDPGSIGYWSTLKSFLATSILGSAKEDRKRKTMSARSAPRWLRLATALHSRASPWPKRHMAVLSHHSDITHEYALHLRARPPSLFTVSLDVVDSLRLQAVHRLDSSEPLHAHQ